MKSTQLSAITGAMLLLSTAAFADEAHHAAQNKGAVEPTSGMQQPEMMSKMDMSKMQKTMEKIHNTQDPKARQALMKQHMKEMHQGMKMMQGVAPEKSGELGGAPSMKSMMKRHQMMEQRMNMMQEMMNQMMQHMQQQGMSKGKH